MPFVPTSEALNQPVLSLADVEQRLGPPPWRRALVGSDSLRVVFYHLTPGEGPHPLHLHPRADEVMVVLRGVGAFTFADGREERVGPGGVVFCPRGQRHALHIPGPEPLVFLAIVGPNEDAPDEAIEDAEDAAEIG